MKRIIALSFFLFLYFPGQNFAQENIKVDYEHVYYIEDDHTLSSYYTLFASQGLSLFRMTSADLPEESPLKANEDESMTSTTVSARLPIRNDLYVNIDKEIITKVSAMQNRTQQINDTPPSLDWHITEESKEIGKYIAIKAEVTFRGRDFEAWFTPEIPIPAGPWKLYGLPGLILEVADKEKEYLWYARNIKYPADFDSELLAIDPDDIEEELSLQKALKNYLSNQAKEDRLEQSRAKQQDFEISETIYPSRESWLERIYEWE